MMDRLCQRGSITVVRDATPKLYHRVVEIKMKSVFKDGCGPHTDTRSKGVDKLRLPHLAIGGLELRLRLTLPLNERQHN